ncbi:hypothetical protein FRC03_003602 [Tulasnella sp. 419]|nr:hypothetical protein FRC02_011125 [Tulasnella sp. 418]KAG8962932.1 hypothetical protein FRC03_003602 [Tulasnella sp. 419]
MKFSTLAALLASLLVSGVLAAPIGHEEIISQSSAGLRLISLQEGVDPVWKSQQEVDDLIKNDIKFFDVTETHEATVAYLAKLQASRQDPSAQRATFPAPSHQAQVKPIVASLQISNMQGWLNQLTSYNNRYYKATTGVTASTYLYNTLSGIASGKSGITVTQFTHSSFSQKSIIVRFNGQNPSGAITILGAHIDTINQSSPTSGRAPGADDDGSGVVNLIEAFRGLVAANFQPSTPLEFHFYAGEEAGLLGSQAIATNYVNSGKSVKAYLNLDMTAYFKPGTPEVIAVVTDYVDAGLNTFLRQLIAAYNSIPAGVDVCNYACSDHASWNKLGIPTTYPFEAPTADSNPYVHSSSDTATVAGFSWTHSLEFAKLAAAFAYELSA